MSTKLNIDNFPAINVKDKLILTADTAVGITSIPVVNSEGYSASDFSVLGNLVSEYSEKIQAPSSGFAPDVTHIVANAVTTMQHKQFDPVWILFGNKIKIWRAPNVNGTYPADNTYTLLTTIDVDVDESSTAYTDATGSNAYWYKVTYQNSVTLAETTLADSPIVIRGGSYGYYTTLEAIRKEAGLYNNTFITDSAIDAARYRAQFELDGAFNGLYNVPFQAPINPMVSLLVEKLAASYLLSIDYGPMASGNSKDADKKLAEFQRLMDKIDNKTYVLTDVNGTDLSIAHAGGNKSWPNDTTDTTPVDQGGSTRTFRMGMRF